MEWIGQNEGRNQVKYPACRDSLLLSLGILATHTHKYLHNITVAITHTLRPPSLSIPILKSSQSLSLLPVLAHFLSTSIPLTLPPSLVFAYPPFPPLYGHSFSLPHFSFLSFSLTHPLPPLSLFLSYPYLFPYSSLTLSLPLSLLPSLSLFLSYPYFSLTITYRVSEGFTHVHIKLLLTFKPFICNGTLPPFIFTPIPWDRVRVEVRCV